MRASNGRLGIVLGAVISFTAGGVACVGDAAMNADPGAEDGSGGSDSTATSDASMSADGSSSGNDGGDSGSNLDGGGGDAAACPGETGCPALVGGGHLQLWLRGDKGVDCPAFRITTWHDQSAHGRNATAALNDDGGPALAPQCNIDKINNLFVPSFTNPIPSGGTAFTPSSDETLQVDLGFLKGHEYTIAIVHKQSAYIVVTGLLAFAHPVRTSTCPLPLGPVNLGALALGLTHDPYDGGNEQYNTGFECYGSFPGTSSMAPELIEYTFDNLTGHHLFVNAVERPLVTTVGDASAANLIGITQDGGEVSVIGRLPPVPSLPLNLRYKGNIAEIVAYDVALSSADRFVVETYLKTKWALPF